MTRRLFLASAPFLPLALPARAKDRGAFRLAQSVKRYRLAIDATFATVPDMRLFAPAPQAIEGYQWPESTEMMVSGYDIKTRTESAKPGSQPFLIGDLLPRSSTVNVRMEYTFRIALRRLERGTPGRLPDAAPPKGLFRDPLSQMDDPVFKQWLQARGLVWDETTDPLEGLFAVRSAIYKDFSYKPDKERKIAEILKARATNCVGGAIINSAAAETSGLPTEILNGFYVVTGSSAESKHTMTRTWVNGLGWLYDSPTPGTPPQELGCLRTPMLITVKGASALLPIPQPYEQMFLSTVYGWDLTGKTNRLLKCTSETWSVSQIG